MRLWSVIPGVPMVSLRHGPAVFLAAFLGGCTCQSEQDIVFPPSDGAGAADPPTSFGSWLSFDTSPEGQRLTMSYYDKDRGALGYAVGAVNEDGTVSWAHEQAAGYPDDNGLDAADAGKYSSQKTAPDGTVWVAYLNASN